MAKKLVQTGEDENGVFNVMDGLSFTRAVNENADTLGTTTKLDLEIYNTPEAIGKALKEQAGKTGWHTPGGPDDIPTHEEIGAPVYSPSKLEDGMAQIYNKALNGGVTPVIVGIRVKTAPTKTDYTDGEMFDPAGMEVVADTDQGTEIALSDTDYTYTPTTALTTTDTEIIIYYQSFTTTQAITVV